MTFKNKRRLKIIGTYCLGWTLAFIFLSIVRGVGATEDGALDFEVTTSILYSITIGPFIGAISGLAQILTDEWFYRRTSIRKLITIRLAFSLIFLFTLILISYWIVPPILEIEIGFVDFLFDEGSSAIYFYIFVVDVFLASLWQINQMFGSNNLWKVLMGKFYEPNEENRIFMFLDLKDSTVHAERLGHITYSKLLQDCFNDLGVVIENEAEIYQYVGDEAVLTWKIKEGLRNQNCINAFYSFKNKLLSKQDYYTEKYNCTPIFKAGLNLGIVTTTEVGKYKKEIAYHGDTINTAARIQKKCNALNEELLISENLKNKLMPGSFKFNRLGNIPLKGKKQDVAIFSVSS